MENTTKEILSHEHNMWYQTKLWFFDIKDILETKNPICDLSDYFSGDDSDGFVEFLLTSHDQNWDGSCVLTEYVSLFFDSDDYSVFQFRCWWDDVYVYDAESWILSELIEETWVMTSVIPIVDKNKINKVVQDCNEIANTLANCYTAYQPHVNTEKA
jgi:hypothetical protein